jgi:tetratricopeptide (TPR) repeat protein
MVRPPGQPGGLFLARDLLPGSDRVSAAASRPTEREDGPMKGSKKLAFAGAVFLLAATLRAQDWAGRGRAQGFVEDEAGKPIAGATVTLHSPADAKQGPAPIQTDKKGHWAVLGLADGTWTVTVEDKGYLTAEGPWKVSEFGVAKPLVVKLKTLTPEMVEAAREKANPVEAAIKKGNALLASGKTAEARSEYQAALDKVTDPASKVMLLCGIAQSYQAEKDDPKAITVLEQAQALSPDDVPTQKLLAISYYQTKQPDKAIALLKALFEKNPSDVGVGQTLVNFLIETGNEAEANEYLAKLPAGAKVDPSILLNMGIQHYNDGKAQEAEADFEKVVQENPEMPDAYYYRGLVRLSLNKFADAKADFKKSLELAPNGAHAEEIQSFLKYLEKN